MLCVGRNSKIKKKIMEDLKLIHKTLLFPKTNTEPRRMFLSNIDLSLLGHHEHVSFFHPPSNCMSFERVYEILHNALEALLVPYDFLAGRLVPAAEDAGRLEIDCDGSGIILVVAQTTFHLSELGDLYELKPDFRGLTSFLYDKGEEHKDLKDLPLLRFQLTQFGCGSIALAMRLNHCTVDGVAIHDFLTNFAAVTRGNDLVVMPHSDRTIFRARNPLRISYPHYEHSKTDEGEDPFLCRTFKLPGSTWQAHLVYLPPQRIESLKRAALSSKKIANCSVFQVVAARIWKARAIGLKIPSERYTKMLFPTDTRKRVVPEVPRGFAGNAILPGYARARVGDLVEADDGELVREVQEGIGRLTEEYIRSCIDWLEVNKGVHWGGESFSVVALWRLGLDEDEFAWGRPICSVPVELRPWMVVISPGPREGGGINVCVEMNEDQIIDFRRLMLED